MKVYAEAAMEKGMTRQQVISRVFAKKIRWIEAVEILGCGSRKVRRIKENFV